MSTPMGFRYLHGAEYIEREMSLWFDVRPCHLFFNQMKTERYYRNGIITM